jgi:manganese transport protein
MRIRERLGKTALGQTLRYLGPGFIVTVGFIDPGNWATNIAGGSQFGYELLWIITLSTLMLILLQHMSARLGIVTGRSMAANVRTLFPRWVSNLLGVTIVLACAATDLAEYLGAALGFYLLFRIPPALGAPLTVALVIAAVLGQRYKRLERMIIGFLTVIAGCYVIELVLVRPEWSMLLPSIVLPSVSSQSILVAMAILGAVVMPHNIYLHSNVIQSRDWEGPPEKKRRLLKLEFTDTVAAMGLGWIVNSAMIVVAAAVFFRHGIQVTSIEQASATLRPLAGHLAQLLFGIALLFAGVGSSITSSMSEANVITGYLGKPEDPKGWVYRIGLVATAIPALVIIAIGVDSYKALILSQVALSIQLPFTIIPLLLLVGSRKVMGEFASGWLEKALGWVVAVVVLALNGLLLFHILGGKF